MEQNKEMTAQESLRLITETMNNSRKEILRTVIRGSEDDFFQQCPARLRHLDIEIVVADEPEQDAVAIDAPVPHHFLHGNLTGSGALVRNILNKICTTSHSSGGISISFCFFPQRGKT